MKTIRLLGLRSGEPHEMNGQYVISYDPDYHLPGGGEYDGGRLICTPDRGQATRFGLMDAILLVHASPNCTCHQFRADGRPNRPLSAFNIVVE
jgi:hypothetical protein